MVYVHHAKTSKSKKNTTLRMGRCSSFKKYWESERKVSIENPVARYQRGFQQPYEAQYHVMPRSVHTHSITEGSSNDALA